MPSTPPVRPSTIAWTWVTVAATRGAEKLVPSMPARGMSSPSARMSTPGPLLLNSLGRPLPSCEPTLITSGIAAG